MDCGSGSRREVNPWHGLKTTEVLHCQYGYYMTVCRMCIAVFMGPVWEFSALNLVVENLRQLRAVLMSPCSANLRMPRALDERVVLY